MKSKSAAEVKVEKKLKIAKKMSGVKRIYGGSCAHTDGNGTCSIRGSIS